MIRVKAAAAKVRGICEWEALDWGGLAALGWVVLGWLIWGWLLHPHGYGAGVRDGICGFAMFGLVVGFVVSVIDAVVFARLGRSGAFDTDADAAGGRS